jgi:hypothetical protein
MKAWFKNRFKSRAERERGYAVPSLYGTRWGRLRSFYRSYGIPNPKELLMLLFPSEWLSEKLWPRWDPDDRNVKVAPAPKAGCYSAEHGITRCADGRVVRGKLHVPGA